MQESEEMKSNTLGVQLKRTEHELKQHEREIADQLRVRMGRDSCDVCRTCDCSRNVYLVCMLTPFVRFMR